MGSQFPCHEASVDRNGCAQSATGRATYEDAFSCPRDFAANQFVYLVVSSRAGGLSVGINLNPAVNCNLLCRYCEVDRNRPGPAAALNIERMTAELVETLRFVNEGHLVEQPPYANFPKELLRIRHVALSGDGEPTLAPNFVEALEAVVHLRAVRRTPFFKLVLLTNSTALDRPEVQRGLRLLTSEDEVWAKLDAGTEQYFRRVNGGSVPFEKVLGNILALGRRRRVVIQSLFAAIDGEEPPTNEVEEYALRLKELKEAGAQIPLVQVYSAIRPIARSGCRHLPLKSLSKIARRVRQVAELRAEVF